MNVGELSKIIGKLLAARKMTLSVCESCTGGMLGSIITSAPGSSKYFLGGIIAYSNKVKRIIGVNTDTLRRYGAVSAEVARKMAHGVRTKLKSDIGIGITGIAGPAGGSKKKPVGLVYISVVVKKEVYLKRFVFKGSRDLIRIKACKETLLFLEHILKQS